MDIYTNKIINNPNIVIIFYSDWCGYSEKALELLNNKKIPYKGYNINKISGGIKVILENLVKTKELTNFDPDYKSRPIIFVNGRFIGGYHDLINFLR